VSTTVFISYRRDDTGDLAGRLADRLRTSPGVGEVFLDVAGIEPGADFASRIEGALAGSDVCLVLIGREWTGPSTGGKARIQEDGDFVRLEVRTAMASEARVLPVLAHGARMPAEADLPADIRRLTRLHGVTIRHDSFDRDAQFLIDVILKRRKPSSLGAYLGRHPVQAAALRALAGFVVAAVGLVLIAAFQKAATGRSLDQLLGGAGPVMLLIFVVLAAGTVLPFMIGRRDRAG
jgi:hypothetical protein